MQFDPSGLNRAFDLMRERASSKGKDLAFVVAGQFLRDMRAESRKIAPTAEELTTTAKKLKGRLKRKKGWTPERELARRIRVKGTFARKWKISRKESKPYQIRIWLIDTAADSAKVDSKNKVTDKAEKKTGVAFKSKLDRLADTLTRSF